MELVKILLKAQGCGLQRGIDGLGKVSIHLLESTRSLRYKPIDHVLVLEAACLCIPEVQVGELLTYHHCQLDVGLAMVHDPRRRADLQAQEARVVSAKLGGLEELEQTPRPCQWQGVIVEDHHRPLAGAAAQGEVEG